MLTSRKIIEFKVPTSKFELAELFCAGKVAVKRGCPDPCYPLRMEMFLIATMAALLTVIVVDTGQKRRDILCQQEHTKKPR